MDPELMRAAALTRSQQVRAKADRPSKRSNGVEGDDHPRVYARMVEPTFTLREDGDKEGMLNFQGYASVTDTPYEMYDFWGPYEETVEAGAFTKTLKALGLDVPLVLDHKSLRRIARTTNGTLRLSEDTRGLKVDADLDPEDDDVKYIRRKIEQRLIDEMSFMFRIVEGWWSDDFTQFVIKEVDIHRGDVAIVGYGANPHTQGMSLSPARELVTPALIRGADLISIEDTRPRF